MIEYQPSDSPFFEANKIYCETIQSQLQAFQLDYNGFCNSYGYEIQTILIKDDLAFNLTFFKHQTTQNGVIIPIDAIDNSGLVVRVTGINKQLNVRIGKSVIRRFFTSSKFKLLIPSPYFIQFNNLVESAFIENWLNKVQDYKISTFKLINGTLICKIPNANFNLLGLLADLENSLREEKK